MQKMLLMPGLFLLACLCAGLYGVLHNQISYTVAPDYFHQFKFIQFGIDPAFQNRLGASIVGWRASWWMGVVIGAVLIPIGLLVPGAKNYAAAMSKTFVIVALTALIAALAALTYAYIAISPENVMPVIMYGVPVNRPAEFLRAGIMHNFSYMGGMIGVVTGIAWLLLERKWARKGTHPTGSVTGAPSVPGDI